MARSEKLVRVSLLHEDTEGYVERMNVLVDPHPDLKINCEITLEDSETPDKRWKVMTIYETLDRVSINRGWNNNI